MIILIITTLFEYSLLATNNLSLVLEATKSLLKIFLTVGLYPVY